jgi:hypothetical protein
MSSSDNTSVDGPGADVSGGGAPWVGVSLGLVLAPPRACDLEWFFPVPLGLWL